MAKRHGDSSKKKISTPTNTKTMEELLKWEDKQNVPIKKGGKDPPESIS
jgi:hypothetical protein